MYLGEPRETTSRRGLKLELLVWPRNVVGQNTLLEFVNVEAIFLSRIEGFVSLWFCYYSLLFGEVLN